MTPAQADAVSLALSTEGGTPAAVDVYFDISGSMRGFALAAAANDRAAAPEYFSFLNALRSLPTQLVDSARLGTAPAAEATEEEEALASTTPMGIAATFGAVVDEPIGLEQLIEQAAARAAAPTRERLALPSSTDCAPPQAWSGGALLRGRIDEFYADRTTCLDRVFEAASAGGVHRLNVIVTDAEQIAPVNDASCPNRLNPSTIQSYLNQWTENGGFAALVVASIRYQPWQSQGVSNYCDCGEKLLFTYVLAPSPKSAELVFSHFQDYWRSARPLSYVPLLPRPAVAFEVRATAETDVRDPSLIFRDSISDLNPRRVGALPRVAVELTDSDNAIVEFRLEKTSFQTAALSQFQQIDWSQAQFDWRDPIALGSGGSETTADGLSLVRLASLETTPEGSDAPVAEAPGGSVSRTLRFLAQAVEPPEDAGQPQLPPLRLRVRRTDPNGEGSAWFLIEVTAPIREQNRHLLETLQNYQSTGCLDWDQVRQQLDSLVQRGPVMRFLLNIDY